MACSVSRFPILGTGSGSPYRVPASASTGPRREAPSAAVPYHRPMTEFALKEWGVTCEALGAGDQVLIVRKGGIGEKRFDLPHPRFFLYPTYLHQRPELVKPQFHERYATSLERRDEPERLPLALYAEMVSSYALTGDDALAAVDAEHTLTPDYAAERLKWRRKHPLWAAVLRVWRVHEPPVLDVGPEHGGCVSWIALPDGIRAGDRTPVLGDDAFAAAEARVTAALAPFAAPAPEPGLANVPAR